MNSPNILPSRQRRNTITNAGMNVKTRLFNNAIDNNREIFDASVANIILNIKQSNEITFIEKFPNDIDKKIYIAGGSAYYLYGEWFKQLNENNGRNLVNNCPRTHDYDIYIIANRTLTEEDMFEFEQILRRHAELLSNRLKLVNGHLFNNNNINIIDINEKKLVKINKIYAKPHNRPNSTIDYQYNMTLNFEGVHYTDHIFEFIIYQSMPENILFKNLDSIKKLNINNNIFDVIPIKYLISLSLNSLLNRYSRYIKSSNPMYLGKVKQDACRINYLFKCLKLDKSSYLKILYKIFNNILYFIEKDIISRKKSNDYNDYNDYNSNILNINNKKLLDYFDESAVIDPFIQHMCYYQFKAIEPTLQHYINSFIITI